MGCLYANNGFVGDEGECSLWDEQEFSGCDENGVCVCLDDPDPSNTCESYESDYTCSECGADLNNEECDCEEL